MTPAKEKALELVNKFYKYAHDGSNGSYYDTKVWSENAKNCALITVYEIIKQEAERCLAYKETDKFVDYWQEVKQEIELL